MEFVLFLGIFAIIVAIIASNRGRSGFGWFLLSLLISPILAIILLVCLPKLNSSSIPDGVSPSTHVKCPDCAEFVKNEAKVCKHCGCKLIPAAT